MIKDFMQVSTTLRREFIGMTTIDFASYYTFSQAVANDAENAQTNRVCGVWHFSWYE